jgi:hypothetical protein
MPNRAKLAVVLGIILFSISLPNAQAEVNAVGTSCPKVGEVAKSASGVVVCVNDGGKIIWQIQTSSSSPSPETPSGTPITSKSGWYKVSSVQRTSPCVIGKKGPGGGIIFYDAGSVKRWGRCLEAAPSGWFGTPQDPTKAWCNVNLVSFGVTSLVVGGGRANTALLISHCSSGAAVTAAAYHGGAKSDWYLPSQDELNAMYVMRVVIGGLASASYWSSSEQSIYFAYAQRMSDGLQLYGGKLYNVYVHPIRAF